ncbi:anaerobic sulfatase maturase [Vibrio astriarenae]
MTSSVPYSLSIKPIGSKCNLDCSYCYYLNHNSGCGDPMSDEQLKLVIKNHIDSQPKHSKTVDFIWHGGEPLLRGRAFFQNVVLYQKQQAGTKRIMNTIQTNGTLINESWAAFFKQHNFMVGISLDGPNLLNDMARIDLKGQSSFERTMRGLTHPKQAQVEFNTLTVVNNRTFHHGAHIYRFLRDNGSQYLQFQPCIDHELDRRSRFDWSLSGEQWGEFLCDVFDEWCKNDIGKVYVQFFENCLLILMGHASQMCHHAPTCGQQLMMEANGSVYSCDRYGYDSHKLGNGMQTRLESLVNNQQQINFGQAKQQELYTTCQQCDFLLLCQGGCPKNRTEITKEGQSMNRLCAGYQVFFRYALPRLLKMVDAMNNGYGPQYYALF